MTIQNRREGDALTLALSGRLDTTTAPMLENEIASLDGVAKLTLDFTQLEYISSAGLRVLLVTQKKMNAQGSMTLRGVSEEIREILDITGFSDILTIE